MLELSFRRVEEPQSPADRKIYLEDDMVFKVRIARFGHIVVPMETGEPISIGWFAGSGSNGSYNRVSILYPCSPRNAGDIMMIAGGVFRQDQEKPTVLSD